MRGAALVAPRAASVCAVVAALALALALAGCATTTNSAVNLSSGRLDIYASQPPGDTGGQTATDVLDAEQLALKQIGSTVGKFTLRLIPLHGNELSDNARTAIQDQKAIAYLGEIEPGTSQISVEITNELGMLEVSPTDTAVYLTQATPAVSGAPGNYYPSNSSYHETFARVVPTTAQEAKAVVAEMQSLHLTKLYVSSDGQPYGASIADEVSQDAPGSGLTVLPAASASSADAVFYGSNSTAAATAKLDQYAAASPGAKLFVPSALYEDSFAAGLSAGAQKNLFVSSPGFAPSALTPAGQQFVSSFRSAYGHQPVPEAIFGYEAMSALLASLHNAGKVAGNRAAVVNEFRALKDPANSVVGPFSISAGDTSLSSFIFASPQGGKLVPRSQG
jgi:branched-chain amino acid transport system substrate-binding protein